MGEFRSSGDIGNFMELFLFARAHSADVGESGENAFEPAVWRVGRQLEGIPVYRESMGNAKIARPADCRSARTLAEVRHGAVDFNFL
jgi:hypothetical protein